MNSIIIIGVVLLLFMLLPRGLMKLRAGRMKGKAAPTLHKASGNRIRSGEKTVLYFYTPSCGACKMQEPIIAQINKQHANAVFKIDASKNRDAARAYGVMGVPFIAFIEDGKISRALAGVQSEANIRNFLEG